jgi:hypothetical protein
MPKPFSPYERMVCESRTLNDTSAALVFIFFACGEDFLRSSLGPGWLELAIFDWRFAIGDSRLLDAD